MSRSFIFARNDIKRCSSAGRTSSSPAGAVTSLILMLQKRTTVTSLVLFGVLLGIVMNFFDNGNTYAADSTLTLTVSDTVSTDVVASSTGNFASGTGTVSVTTDHITGYTLTIAASSDSDNGALTGTNGTIPTINATCMNNATSISEANFSSRTECNDMWGYKPSYYNSATNTNYLPSPNTTGDTLDVTSSANTTAKTYNITVGAKVTDNTASGSYAKTFVISAVGNLIPYTIKYESGVVTGMPSDVSDSTSDSSITLSPDTPVRDGYDFLGWCTVQPTKNGNTDTCTGGTQYAAGATYSLSNGANLNLYAMWGEENNLMQNFTLAKCQSKASDANYAVVDARDDKEYTVRYINGACWMTQNLRYLGDTGSAARTMTIGNNNSNVANKSITLYSLNSSNAGNFNAYTDHCDSTNSDNYACVYDSGNTTTGVWYNYYAASAGTISGDSDTTEASNDICPKNWHLPNYDTANPAGSINSLAGLESPSLFAPVADGYYRGGSLDPNSSSWWSTTYSHPDTRTRYILTWHEDFFSGKYELSNGSVTRRNGSHIRCTRST